VLLEKSRKTLDKASIHARENKKEFLKQFRRDLFILGVQFDLFNWFIYLQFHMVQSMSRNNTKSHCVIKKPIVS